MKAFKVSAAVFLAFILFFCLSLFSLAFTLKVTAANASFVTSRLNDFPVSSLMQDAEVQKIIAQTPELADNPEVVASIGDFITQHEAEIKVRIGNAISDVYDYLLGKSPDLDLPGTLRATVLDPALAIQAVDGLDMVPLIETFIRETVPVKEWSGVFPIELYLGDAAAALEPWVKEQAGTVLPPVFDYVLGRSRSLSLVIQLEPIKPMLRDALKVAFLKSPPPQLAGLTAAQLEQEFDTRYEQFSDQIPATVTLGASFLDLGTVKTEVIQALGEAEKALGEARKSVGYFQLGFGLLIGFILLLILGIVLIYREVRASTRTLGITFLLYGVSGLAGVFIARGLSQGPIARLDVPQSLKPWLGELVASSLTPLLIIGVLALVLGAALFATSLIYKPRQDDGI
jgi:hypothetical protein